MSKWLLLYKGDFTQNLKGPEIRYLKIAEQLAMSGDEVTIAGSRGNTQGDVGFIAVGARLALAKRFLTSDTIMIHGGGPFILLLVLIAKLRGKQVLLDNYAPHWLELFTASSNTTHSKPPSIKIAYNLFRTLFGLVVCDAVIAANKRQQDLYRGLAASTGNLQLLDKVVTLGFGCDPIVAEKSRKPLLELSEGKIGSDDILLGWIGGLWEWFDYKPIVAATSSAATTHSRLKLVFFGVSKDKQQEVEQYIASLKQNTINNFIFMPWVEFNDRLEVWSGLDAGIVWANQSIENDYAARTRNYDCISARLPIIQNWDDHWGPIIKEHRIGITTNEDALTEDLMSVSADRQSLDDYAKNIAPLYNDYSWDSVVATLQTIKTSRKRRASISSALALLVTGPIVLLNVLLHR